ncbi:AAA family ATPase [Planctomycetota bacterium]|nr:AAA family ATPase [Planctomycetota bacterium]
MKLEKIRIVNFRSFEDETILLRDFNAFLGPNGSGKSTILAALNILFRENTNSPTNIHTLTEQDFHNKNTASPITITVTFTDLSDEAKEDFAAYVRQERLIVTAKAEYNSETNSAIVSQLGQRLGIDRFKPFFQRVKEGVSVKDLVKPYYESLQDDFELPKWRSKDLAAKALHDYESEHPNECVTIPSND